MRTLAPWDWFVGVCVCGHKLCAGNLIVALYYYSPPQWKHLDQITVQKKSKRANQTTTTILSIESDRGGFGWALLCLTQ